MMKKIVQTLKKIVIVMIGFNKNNGEKTMTSEEKAEWLLQLDKYRMVRRKIRDGGRKALNEEDREILKRQGDFPTTHKGK